MDSTNRNEQQHKTLVSAEEQAQIARAVRAWLQGCPNKPADKVDFEYIGDAGGLAMSTVQGAWKTNKYITGGYRAQYQFQLALCTIPENTDERMKAAESLDVMGEWATTTTPPDLGEKIRAVIVRRDTPASFVARYENGMEEYHTQLTLIYEVI